MEYLNIETTQNIDLEFKSASVGDRILAYGFDLLIMLLWNLTWFLILGRAGGLEMWHIVFTLPIVFYSLICELFLNGQSFGKMIFKIKVAKLDGSELTLGTCVIRWLFRIVDNWLLLGSVAVLTVILSNKSQRLGDLTAGTTVVKLNKANLFTDTSYLEVPEGYIVKYPQVNMLNDEDANTLKEVLKLTSLKNNADSESIEVIVNKTRRAIQKKLNIDVVDKDSKDFLETVLLDYNCVNK